MLTQFIAQEDEICDKCEYELPKGSEIYMDDDDHVYCRLCKLCEEQDFNN